MYVYVLKAGHSNDHHYIQRASRRRWDEEAKNRAFERSPTIEELDFSISLLNFSSTVKKIFGISSSCTIFKEQTFCFFIDTGMFSEQLWSEIGRAHV